MADAPYHVPVDPLGRILAYVAFRWAIIEGDPAQFTCLVGTMVQEVHQDWRAIREACSASILGHAVPRWRPTSPPPCWIAGRRDG